MLRHAVIQSCVYGCRLVINNFQSQLVFFIIYLCGKFWCFIFFIIFYVFVFMFMFQFVCLFVYCIYFPFFINLEKWICCLYFFLYKSSKKKSTIYIELRYISNIGKMLIPYAVMILIFRFIFLEDDCPKVKDQLPEWWNCRSVCGRSSASASGGHVLPLGRFGFRLGECIHAAHA